MSEELNELGVARLRPGELARNQIELFHEPFVPDLMHRPRTITGEFVFKNRTEWTRMIQVVMGVKPSIKYGERRWGAFA